MLNEQTVDIGTLELSCGGELSNVRQVVTTYGDARNPVVLIPHALTGNSRPSEWWPGLVGEGRAIDPRRHFIVGINALGSCYGSTGPADVDPFPYITVRDVVAAQRKALDALGIGQISLAIGASLGGMQALQWALDDPQRVRAAIIVGAHDHHSAMGVALNGLQREAIALDPAGGLRLARKIAMLSYKSDALLRRRHDRRADRKNRFRFDVEGYLQHQAERLEARMDPRSYAVLTQVMDSFDVRDLPKAADAASRPRLLFVGISSDWLFLPSDVLAAADRFGRAGYDSSYVELHSDHGHDAFLAEPESLGALITPWLLKAGDHWHPFSVVFNT